MNHELDFVENTDWFLVVHRLSRFAQAADLEWTDQIEHAVGPADAAFSRGRAAMAKSFGEVIEAELEAAQSRKLLAQSKQALEDE